MERNKKIIIPVGDASAQVDGAETVRAPLFDEEATMGARPVVPIAAVYTPRTGRFPLLALVVLLAASAGVAGGFVIGLYKSNQNRQGATSPAAATATTASTGTDQSGQTPAEQQQLPATIASDKSPAAPPRTVTPDRDAAVEHSGARDDRAKRDEKDEASAPAEARVREKQDRADRDDEERIARDDEEREIRRQQRRERRRRARQAEEGDVDVNRQIERGERELNRIREIFEGQRP